MLIPTSTMQVQVQVLAGVHVPKQQSKVALYLSWTISEIKHASIMLDRLMLIVFCVQEVRTNCRSIKNVKYKQPMISILTNIVQHHPSVNILCNSTRFSQSTKKALSLHAFEKLTRIPVYEIFLFSCFNDIGHEGSRSKRFL